MMQSLPPVHFDGILGVHGGEVVEGRDQQPLAALCPQEFRQQRVGAHRLPAGVERRELQRRQSLVYAFGNASHAISDGGARIGEIADQHLEDLLAWPGFSRESTESAPGDAAGGAVIGAVERRAGQRIDQCQGRNDGGGKAPGDLGIRLGIGVVFDQQVDFGGNRGLGIGDGTGGVAGIVKIEHVDRQGARRQFKAAP